MSIDAAIEELSTLLGQRLSRSKSDLDQHGTSETHFALTPPDAVAYPANTEEVSAIVKICARHHCPVVGFGAGTSLEGQTLAVQGGVVVDFRDMAAVLHVGAEDMDVTV
ncbi:MAG: FAD-binding protein, partial [Pseudomonadota bacterium]|nr:FAD-binding protein [Pseudomonadota bacterium]